MVEYQVVGGLFTNVSYVSLQLNRIFDYRQKRMEEFFRTSSLKQRPSTI